MNKLEALAALAIPLLGISEGRPTTAPDVGVQRWDYCSCPVRTKRISRMPVLEFVHAVGNEAVPAVERLRTKVRVCHPQHHRLPGTDNRLHRRLPSTGAVVLDVHMEHIQLPHPRRPGPMGGPDITSPISSPPRSATGTRLSR